MKRAIVVAGIAAVLALPLVACSSGASGSGGDGGPGASGGSGGTAAPGGTGGGAATCGPGDLDCLCPGAHWECVSNRTTCFCPPQCTRNDGCGAGETCVFPDGNCGGAATGYCQSLARLPGVWGCGQTPACGCDGQLYDNACAAITARVSPSAAPTNDCAARPQPCNDSPAVVSCYPSQLCRLQNQSGSLSGWCAQFDATCAQPSCDCVSYNAQTCACERLASGLVRLTCRL